MLTLQPTITLSSSLRVELLGFADFGYFFFSLPGWGVRVVQMRPMVKKQL
jgi:hypothetical protein